MTPWPPPPSLACPMPPPSCLFLQPIPTVPPHPPSLRCFAHYATFAIYLVPALAFACSLLPRSLSFVPPLSPALLALHLSYNLLSCTALCPTCRPHTSCLCPR
ncbi:hypothetical protein BDW22DRAFT_429790 [Trametopsis cervina]|nr:hypothetical protein BDW22DRAFT_429790 [Trametopsis cervina]